MLPYLTTRRRLLVMVRAFGQRFEDFLVTQGSRCRSSPDDGASDHELEAFLDRGRQCPLEVKSLTLTLGRYTSSGPAGLGQGSPCCATG